jgi:hypothetical protein
MTPDFQSLPNLQSPKTALTSFGMRLLRTSSAQRPSGLQLVDFNPNEIPPYAILSHTWGKGEVLYSDVISGTAHQREAFQKVHDACQQAREDDYEYIWIDTCCIDKSSSAELSEAINSMFAWYRDSDICYAFLSDLETKDEGSFVKCRWWTRGWTLQELIAPRDVIFYDANWAEFGNKASLAAAIAKITRIDENILAGVRSIESASVANRMGWAARRITTRPEDMAYCLMGIFSVNMPLLYGEGMKAFARLQEEIMKSSTDQSLFAWVDKGAPDDKKYGLLAPSPQCFETTHTVVPYDPRGSAAPYAMTNEGLSIQLVLQAAKGVGNKSGVTYNAILNCPPPNFEAAAFLCVYLVKNGTTEDGYARVKASTLGRISLEGNGSYQSSNQLARMYEERKQLYIRAQPESRGSLYLWRYISLGRRPDTSIYKVLMICKLKSGAKPQVQGMSWGSESILLRGIPGQVTSVIVFERVSNHQRFFVALGSLDHFALAFWADEMDAGPDTMSFDTIMPMSMFGWAAIQDQFRPTPMEETLVLTHHIIKMSTKEVVRQSAKYHSVDFDITPIGESAAPSEASFTRPKRENGRFKQLVSSLTTK